MTRNTHNYDGDDGDHDYPSQKSSRSAQDRYALARSDPRSTLHPGRPQPAGGNPSSATARRRIPVACGRCRKRKIKCSGDPDGTGCSNCKQASMPPGACLFLRAGSSALDIMHPYVPGTASASASSLPLSYESGSTLHQSSSLRASHSSAALNPGFHTGASDMMSLKPIYHHDGLSNSGQDTTNGLLLGSTNGLSDINGTTGGSNVVYESSFPQYMLPEIGNGLQSNGVLQPDLCRNWTPLGAANRAHSSLYMDQDHTNGQSYIGNMRMSPPNTEAYASPGNIFPALSNLSDTLSPAPSTTAPTSHGYTKHDKIILPGLQSYARSHSLDMGTLSSRSTAGSSSILSDPSLTSYHANTAVNSGSFKNYPWSNDSHVGSQASPYTFAPQKSSISPQYSGDTAISRSGPAPLQPAPTLAAGPIPRSSFPATFASGYTSLPPFPLASSAGTLIPPPGIFGSGDGEKGDRKRDAMNGDNMTPKGFSPTGSSVPSPYSSSPTSSMYGTSSQPPTPLATRATNDKGQSIPPARRMFNHDSDWVMEDEQTAQERQAEDDNPKMAIGFTLGEPEYFGPWEWEGLNN